MCHLAIIEIGETLSPSISRMISKNNDTVERFDDLCKRLKSNRTNCFRKIKGGNVLVATSSCALDALIDVMFPN